MIQITLLDILLNLENIIFLDGTTSKCNIGLVPIEKTPMTLLKSTKQIMSKPKMSNYMHEQ